MNHSSKSAGRLRILHIVPSWGVGGAEQMAAHLMSGLCDSHEVIGVGLAPAVEHAIEQRIGDAGIPLRCLNKRPGFDAKLYLSVDRILKEIRPHVVHTHLGVLRYALPALLRRRVPLMVHTVHNLAEHETDIAGRVIHWLAFRCGVLPVAISREVAASVKRVYGVECRAMVPNCIPVELYHRSLHDRVRWRRKAGFDADAILFVCVGRLEPQKNPLLMLEAFAALRAANAHLILLGEGSLRPQLTSFIHEHKLERQVHLLGKRDGIPEYLAAADVFILSSDWEGSPLAVMEAMAAGLPVIGTAVGGVPELVASGREGILVRPGDLPGLTRAMRELIDNPRQRSAMAAAARVHAITAFGVDRMARGYADVYRAALAGVSRRAAWVAA